MYAVVVGVSWWQALWGVGDVCKLGEKELEQVVGVHGASILTIIGCLQAEPLSSAFHHQKDIDCWLKSHKMGPRVLSHWHLRTASYPSKGTMKKLMEKQMTPMETGTTGFRMGCARG